MRVGVGLSLGGGVLEGMAVAVGVKVAVGACVSVGVGDGSGLLLGVIVGVSVGALRLGNWQAASQGSRKSAANNTRIRRRESFRPFTIRKYSGDSEFAQNDQPTQINSLQK